MADTSQAKLSFLPWVRYGAAAAITVPDIVPPAVGTQPTFASIDITPSVNGAALPNKVSVALRGPADVVGIDSHQIVRTDPRPGSHDFEELMAAGRVAFTPEYYYLALARSGATPKVYNERMTPKQVVFAQFGMLLAFYATAYLTRPWRVFGVIGSLLTGKESTQLDQLLRTKWKQMLAPRRREAAAGVA